MKKFVNLFVIPALMVGTVAFAHDKVANPAVDVRMHAMNDIAQNVATIGKMAQGSIEFNAEAAQAALAVIAEQAGKISELFEANETDPKSKASPQIWVDFDAFAGKAESLRSAAAGADGSSVAGLGQALGAIGGTCRSCHMSFKN